MSNVSQTAQEIIQLRERLARLEFQFSQALAVQGELAQAQQAMSRLNPGSSSLSSFKIGLTTGVIGPRSGSTPGSNTCNEYALVGGSLTSTGNTFTALNLPSTGSGTASGVYVGCLSDAYGNFWNVLEDC